MVGAFLYYQKTVDLTMMVAFHSIASEQAISTQFMAQAVFQILNYAATHSEAITIYHASRMVLQIHINTSFLSYPV